MGEAWREALARRGVTSRELDVLGAVAERLSNAEIAGRLGVSERTVESHVSSLLRKLEASGRRELVALGSTHSTSASRAAPDPGRLPSLLGRMIERGGCFGRDRELARLLELWEAATETSVVVLRGEPGIGKSRIAAELAAAVHGRGGQVIFGACVDGPQRPYEPFVAALADAVGSASGRTVLDPLFAPLATAADGATGSSDVVDPDRDRVAVQHGLSDLLAELAAPDGLLFVLEDLHWASDGTLEALDLIVRAPRRARLLVVATTRDDGPSVDDGHRAHLGRLTQSPSVTAISLAGLDVAAAAQLIDEAGAVMDPVDSVARTGGNPLFLRELTRGGPDNWSLREVVADRFRFLSADDVDVVDVAAVAGGPIDTALVAAALGRDHHDVLDAMERIESAGIVAVGGPAGTFAFTHDVFRSGRYADLTASRRMRLHAALADALDRATEGGGRAADVARHACLAGARFDRQRAVELARRAADIAARATDHGEAIEHHRRALDAMALDPTADEHVRLAVMIDLGASLVLIGDPDGHAVLQTAARAARQHDDHIALAAAMCAMGAIPGESHDDLVLDEEFETVLARTIHALPGSATSWRIRLLAILGVHLFYKDDMDRGAALLAEAVTDARHAGDPITLGRALIWYRFCGGPLDSGPRLACGRELIELGERTGQTVFTTVGQQQLSWCFRELGDRAAMTHWHHAAAQRMNRPDREQLSQATSLALADGDLDRADRICDDIDQLEAGRSLYADPLRFMIADLRGRRPDEGGLRAQLETQPHQRRHFEALLARLLARTGRTTEAGTLLDAARDTAYEPRYAPQRWTMAIGCLADAAAVCGHAECGADIVELFEPLAGRWIDPGAGIWDTVDRVRALALLTAGDPATAHRVAAHAVNVSRRQETPILLARELVVLAAATERLGGDGSDDLREALAIAHRTGARIIIHDARLLLATSVLDDEVGLTLREREVIDRIATGETNGQIARALGIAEATVRKHLEHAFRKLQVSTRTGAVARAAELRAMAPQPSR